MKKRVWQHISCVGCYAAWLKDGLYAVTDIKIKILIHMQTFIPETNWSEILSIAF